MARNLATVALVLSFVALFLPIRSMMGISEGAFGGDLKNVALGMMLTMPTILAAVFGATIGRRGFARGLGTLHLVLGTLALGLCGVAATRPAGIQLASGGYMAIVGGLLVVAAGLVGLIQPERK